MFKYSHILVHVLYFSWLNKSLSFSLSLSLILHMKKGLSEEDVHIH